MVAPRIIPVLLMDGGGLVKTVRFKKPRYVGDPINACRIFNEKEVDELVVLDIRASELGQGPDLDMVALLGTECFMPVAYGGGFRTLSQMRRGYRAGAEKIVLGTALFESSELVERAAREFGSQSVVACLDVKRSLLGRREVVHTRGTKKSGLGLADAARQVVDSGAGEIIVQSVDRDGTYSGYDLDAVREVAEEVDVPVVALGGASGHDDLRTLLESGFGSAAAGSMFVYQGPHRAVLISYPSPEEVEEIVGKHGQAQSGRVG